MEELIKYFESLETRLAAAEQSVAAAEERLMAQNQQITALEAKIAELENRPAPEPQVIEKIVEVEKPVEKIVEKIVEVEKPIEKIVEKIVEVEKPVVVEEPLTEEEPVEITETTETTETTEPTEPTEPTATPVAQEKPSPKAAIYGKAVDDIRLAISLGDRFLYQRELFGQNAERMQRTLTELNELSSFDEAMDYIARFNWDTESKTYQQFLVTLHRRFG